MSQPTDRQTDGFAIQNSISFHNTHNQSVFVIVNHQLYIATSNQTHTPKVDKIEKNVMSIYFTSTATNGTLLET